MARGVVGTLTLGTTESGFFGEEEVGLVGTVADNIGLALRLAAKRRRVAYLTLYDTLTDLPNRALAEEPTHPSEI